MSQLPVKWTKPKKRRGNILQIGAIQYEDIFDRDTESFIRTDQLIRANQVNPLMSSGLINPDAFQGKNAQERLIKRGFEMAKRYLPVLKLPRSTKLVLDPRKNRDQLGPNPALLLSIEPFADVNLHVCEQMDCFLGDFFHEAFKYKYCKVEVLRDAVFNKQINAIEKEIFDIVEDERVDQRGGEDFPGYLKYIGKMKAYFFAIKYEWEYLTKIAMIEQRLGHVPKVVRFMDILLKVVRFPTMLTESDLTDCIDYVEQLKDILDIFPEETQESLSTAKKIFTLMEKWAKDEMDEILKKMEEAQAAEAYVFTFGDLQDILDMLAQLMQDAFSSGVDRVIIGNVVVGNGKNPPRGFDGDKPAILNPLALAIIAEIEEQHGKPQSDGNNMPGVYKGTMFVRAKNNDYVYRQVLAALSHKPKTLGMVMRRQHRDRKICVKGTKSGQLDINKLAEAAQGQQTVYEKHGWQKTQKLGVILVSDQSSSMSSEYASTDEEKIDLVQKTCILLDNGLGMVEDAELFIYGFNTANGNEVNITVYKERNFSPKHALGSMQARGSTPLGPAIDEIGMRVRKMTDRPLLMVVASDGDPDGGSHGRDLVRKAVVALKKINIEVVHIAIDDDAAGAGDMFNHTIEFTEIADLPKKITQFMQRLMTAKMKAKIYI